jgi:cystathionine beta-lyase/cystathionine gamma-synthase
LDIRTCCKHLGIFKLSVSLGGYESLTIPTLITHSQTDGPNFANDFGVPERVGRLHIGFEGADAPWGDLNAAIAAAA